MSVRVLVDTSFLVAQLDERDVHHQTAKALHELFRKREVAYIYLDCVMNETVTVLARRALERKADQRAIIRRLRKEIPTDLLDWEGPELPRLWERALDTLEMYKGRLSFNDCLLVLICQEGGIEWIASFDQSFDKVSGIKRVGKTAAFTTR
ncbi:MAG TPA: type II toxin-antitoxin system VapC family toxin [Thermodesulfobacteriota bacterium]|nr:type II toxin-antitoxin system VapC family toxin [Thermodesulfobacteriota bacterium]